MRKYRVYNIDRDAIYKGLKAEGYNSLKGLCKDEGICYGTVLNILTRKETSIRNDKVREFMLRLMEKGKGEVSDESYNNSSSTSLYDAYCNSQNNSQNDSSSNIEFEKEMTPPQETFNGFEKVFISKDTITYELSKGSTVFCKGSNFFYKLQDNILCRFYKDDFTGESNLLMVNAAVDTSSDYWYVLRRKKIKPEVGHFYKLVDNSIAYCLKEHTEGDYTYKFELSTDKGQVMYNESGIAAYNTPTEREQRAIKEKIDVR